MGAHVFIVNNVTFPITQNRCVAAVVREGAEGGKYREKTMADILADISCIRIGDRIFFYETDMGFHGIYKAASLPFIDNDEVGGINQEYLFGDERNPHFEKGALILPNRLLIEPLKYLENPINEWRSASNSAFGRFVSAIDLRSIFYKKALGRGKSITHLFPEEELTLRQLLEQANTKGHKRLVCNPYKPKNPQPVIFDLKPTSNGEVKYEKFLEGWIIQNIDNPSNNMHQFLGDLNEIECFANYVPVSIAGGNLDIVVFHKRKNSNERYKITIIELKKGRISKSDLEQMDSYVKWTKENLTKRLIKTPIKMEISPNSNVEIIQPVIIGKGFCKSALQKYKDYGANQIKPILVTYNLDYEKYQVNFELL